MAQLPGPGTGTPAGDSAEARSGTEVVLSSLMFTIALGSLAQVRRLSAVEGSVAPSAPFAAGLGFELWRRSEGRGECSDPPCATSDRTCRQSDESQPSTTAQAKGDPRDAAESTALRSSSCLCRWLH